MDFRFTPEQEAFRVRLRNWLESNRREVFGDNSDPLNERDEDSDTRWRKMLEWHRRLHASGYVALHWPKEWGGGGASLVDQVIYQDEVLRLGLPLYGANQLALDRIGFTLMGFGTEEQKRRYLPKMLTAEEIWCQGYSEPGQALTWRDCKRARSSMVMILLSMVKKCGRVSRSAPTCRCCWCALIPMHRSIAASRICWSI